MSKPPPSPGTTRTSRNRALEIGTAKNGFPPELPYDYAGGFPAGTPGQGGTHRDNVSGIQPAPMPAQPKPLK